MEARKQGVSSEDQNSSCLTANVSALSAMPGAASFGKFPFFLSLASKILIQRAVDSRIPQAVNETAPLRLF